MNVDDDKTQTTFNKIIETISTIFVTIWRLITFFKKSKGNV